VADVDPGAPLCVSFRLTLAEYRAAVRRLSLALWPFRVVVGFTILAAIGALGSVVVGYESLAIGLFVVALAYAALLAWVLIIRAAQNFNRLPDLRDEQTYCFSDGEISWTFRSGSSKVKRTYFVDMLETRDLFVLRHPLKRLGSIVPKRAFLSPDAERRFRQLVAGLGSTPSNSKP
jgi:hypothetical protein